MNLRFLLLVLLCSAIPAIAQVAPAPTSQTAGSVRNPEIGPHLSESGTSVPMISVRARLNDTLDAAKVHIGTSFHATLLSSVHLPTGPLLPSGTTLTGEVVPNDLPYQGDQTLAIRFTSAKSGSGQPIPIRAILFDFQPPHSAKPAGAAAWTDDTLKVYLPSIQPGVDLHSAVASQNSATFVSQEKHNLKLPAGTQLSLALAAR